MEIIGAALHQIDHENSLIRRRNTLAEGNQLSEYIERLLTGIANSSSKREFRFQADSTQVRASLNRMLGNSFQEATEGNAERLLNIERQAQEQISHLSTEIQKGSLFQTLVEIESKKHIIICKADHEEILDESDLKIRSGLPMKKQLYKAIMVIYKENNLIERVLVYDTNPKMAKYWWQDYLELCEIYTPSFNTERSIDIIFKKALEPLKEKHPEDYQVLRNSFVGHMRRQEEFDVSHYIESNLKNYEPNDNDLEMDKLIQKTFELPEKYGFDSRFPIDKEKISKRRISQKIKLTGSIDLILNDYVENIRETIQSEEDNQGNKFLKIKTEQGYKWFTEL